MGYVEKPDIIDILRGIDDGEYFAHYGIKRRSGRYPYGSGGQPYQHSGDFYNRVRTMKQKGLKDDQIAEHLGMFKTEFGETKPNVLKLKRQYRLAKNDENLRLMMKCVSMKGDGYSNSEIGRAIGRNESQVREFLKEEKQAKEMDINNKIEAIKTIVDEKGMVDIGEGVENSLRVNRTTFDTCVEGLVMEGYHVYKRDSKQPTGLGNTKYMVLTTPEHQHKDIYDKEKVASFDDYTSDDGGKSYRKTWVYPKSMDSSRITVRYAEEGGLDRDGTVEIRPGVADLNLGGSHYSQVRVLVDGTHYVKGMAVYGDPKDFPPGVDMIFNTNKKKGTPLMSDDPDAKQVLKPIHTEPGSENNPFGSLIKPGINDPTDAGSPRDGGQSYYIDKDGKKQLSLINKRSDEGDWDNWKKTVPAQFLSKQNKKLVQQQLNLSKAEKQDEFETYMSLENPTIKRYFLEKFAKTCDSKASHLDAAAFPRQRYQVLLPATTLKENEVYAPNFKNGEKIALIRFPHECVNQIPILKVNNNNKECQKKLSTNPIDAVAVSQSVAERLSGADFDGDTVLCIPTNSKVNITNRPPLKDLENFDNKREYPYRPGMKIMTKENEGREMGMVSNLLQDMALQGAPDDQVARAVKHSMTVIDAKKHKLDYKLSEEQNGIKELRSIWQKHVDLEGKTKLGGAATIISRSTGQYNVPKTIGEAKVDPKTGKQIWKVAPDKKLYEPVYQKDKNGKFIYDENGERIPKLNKDGSMKMLMKTKEITQMDAVDDARQLIRNVSLGEKYGHPTEEAYADYANKLKSLANQARKAYAYETPLKEQPTAELKKKYSDAIESLDAKIRICESNKPRERRAQDLANARIAYWVKMDPDLTSKANRDRFSKLKTREMQRARDDVGSKRPSVVIDDREWEAIQAGAISHTKLKSILKYCDMDNLRERSMPKASKTVTPTKINRIKAMAASGIPTSEIADELNLSSSTILKYLK